MQARNGHEDLNWPKPPHTGSRSRAQPACRQLTPEQARRLWLAVDGNSSSMPRNTSKGTDGGRGAEREMGDFTT